MADLRKYTVSRYRIQTILAIFLALMMCAIISFIFGLINNTNVKTSYFDIMNASIIDTRDALDVQIQLARDVLFELDDDGTDVVPDGYDSYAVITPEGVGSLYAIGDYDKNVTKREALLPNFDGGDYHIACGRDIFLEWEGVATAYLMVKKVTESGRNVILFRQMEDVVKHIDFHTFNNVIFVNIDGGVYYSTEKGSTTYSYFATASDRIRTDFAENTTKSSVEAIGTNGNVVTLAAASQRHPRIRLVGTSSEEAYNNYVSEYVTNRIVEDIVLIFIVVVAAVLCSIAYRHRFDVFMYVKPISTYAIRVDNLGKLLYANKAYKANFPLAPIGKHIANRNQLNVGELARAGTQIYVTQKNLEGKERTLSFTPLWAVHGYKLIGADATEDVNRFRELERLGTLDTAMGIPKYRLLLNRIDEILKRGRGFHGGMAILSFSNKSRLASMLGEHLFLTVLAEYAKRIYDILIEYGEVFCNNRHDVIFISDNLEKVKTMANGLTAIMERINQPISVNDNIIKLDAELGLVIVDSMNAELTPDDLFGNAYLSLKHASSGAKNNYYILKNANFEKNRTNYTASGVVENMIANGEIEVFFQPQLELETNRIICFEALCRINGDKNNEISTADFISIAEQYGGMLELGEYIYDKAMDFAGEIKDEDISVSVNVSPVQLMKSGFTDIFLSSFQKRDIAEGRFNIEITESTMVHSFNEVMAKLNFLRSHGINTHIDDFGVAYSSMLYIKKLPITALKIDKALIDDINDSTRDASIVKNIVNLCKDLDLECIAEGVENAKQLNTLKELGCDTVQGFFVSRAVSKEKAKELIKEYNHHDE